MQGLFTGLLAFLIIGLFHPLVIKLEYHIGRRGWWFFLVFGLVSIAVSLLATNLWSIGLGVTGFACFWGIFEMFQQHKRVLNGRAKRNPKRNYQ